MTEAQPRVIKRFLFARAGEAQEERPRHPVALRPLRSVLCTSLPEGDPTHGSIRIDWFIDLEALQRHCAWEREHAQPRAAEAPGCIEVIAEEHVLRGADWLEQRWRTRGPKYKHMALARRAPGLTAAQFSERWRNRPGQIGGGQTPSLAIPEAAKGRAYCQNHSVSSEPAYDAINEVYFDELADMRPRLDFFRDHPVAQLDADLVQEPRFLVVREWIL